MTEPELSVAQSVISQQLDLLRLGAYSQSQALELLDEMGRELERMIRIPDLTAFNRTRLNSLLAQATRVIDQYYETIEAATNETLAGAARVQAQATADALQPMFIVSLEASLPTPTLLKKLLTNTLIHGARSADWWARQSDDTAFKFATIVRGGVAQGLPNEAIVSKVVGTPVKPGIMTTSKRNARSLIHASIQAVANEARLETFKANSDIIRGVRQLSTLDGHTTEICIAYSGAEWDFDGNPLGRIRLPFDGGPPRHWGCRSVLVPVLKTFKELGIKADEVPLGMRASNIGPVPAEMTMKQWLDSRSAAELDAQLGKGRATLYRQGKITLQQLLDLKGNPLTLEQLERKYG